MNHTLGMCCIEGAADLQHDSNYSCERHGTFFTNNLLERFPVQVFHHQKHDAVFILTKVGDTQGIWMRNTGGGSGLAREASNNLFISSQGGSQNFDGDSLVHQYMRSAIDCTHTAFAQAFVNTILRSQYLPEKRVASCLQRNTISRAQGDGVRIFNAALRSCLHLRLRLDKLLGGESVVSLSHTLKGKQRSAKNCSVIL